MKMEVNAELFMLIAIILFVYIGITKDRPKKRENRRPNYQAHQNNPRDRYYEEDSYNRQIPRRNPNNHHNR